MIHYPGFKPIAFEFGPFFGLGPLQVRWYGIMYLIGFGAAWILARLRAARPQSTWKPNDVDDVVFYAMLGVILGGRVGYVLFYGMEYWLKDGSKSLRELIVIGFLEDVQNLALGQGLALDSFVPFLGLNHGRHGMNLRGW